MDDLYHACYPLSASSNVLPSQTWILRIAIELPKGVVKVFVHRTVHCSKEGTGGTAKDCSFIQEWLFE